MVVVVVVVLLLLLLLLTLFCVPHDNPPVPASGEEMAAIAAQHKRVDPRAVSAEHSPDGVPAGIPGDDRAVRGCWNEGHARALQSTSMYLWIRGRALSLSLST